ncbi:hypothetical protein OROHE_025808 [Orobanche hederae]
MGASSSVTQKSIHDFNVKDSKGNDVNLDIYKGKVLLVVNVASKCGFTDSNYTQMTTLYSKYKDKGMDPEMETVVELMRLTEKVKLLEEQATHWRESWADQFRVKLRDQDRIESLEQRIHTLTEELIGARQEAGMYRGLRDEAMQALGFRREECRSLEMALHERNDYTKMQEAVIQNLQHACSQFSSHVEAFEGTLASERQRHIEFSYAMRGHMAELTELIPELLSHRPEGRLRHPLAPRRSR